MGCDIHVHVEIRYSGKWEHYACPSVERNYSLFGIMAGVRSPIAPIVEPKGVPEDMSIITRLDYERWRRDAHTASWFHEEEIQKLEDWLQTQKEISESNKENLPCLYFNLEWSILNRTFLFGNSLLAFKKYNDCKYVPDGVDAVRLIFWFDN